MELNGKVAVVTGASMGIGEAIAKLFVQKGANVVFLSRDTTRAEAARARAGHTDRTIALSCDIRNREEIDKVINLTVHSFQRIDIWVNNAGKGIMDASDQADMSSVRDVFNLNFFGALESMQAVVPVMKQQGSGTIINISSVAGHIPLPFHGVYSATKFAMNAVGKAARVELKQAGINVLTVCPGYVRTDFGKNLVRGEKLKPCVQSNPWHQSGACGAGNITGIFETEDGSGCAVAHASGDQAVSVVSGFGGVGNAEDDSESRLIFVIPTRSVATRRNLLFA